MFATVLIIAAIFAGGSQKIENPVSALADKIRQSERIEVTAFIAAALEAEPENISFQRRTKYTIKSEKTIRRLASMVRARADAERRKTGKADSASTIWVKIRGYAKDSDEPIFEARVYESVLMFDRGDARYWVELPPPDSDERSELYNRLSDMNFQFEDDEPRSSKAK